MRIAIVDNDANLLRSLGIVLRRLGYDVQCFAGPDEFLAALDAGLGLDALLVDLVMPRMTGVELVATAAPRLPQRCRKAVISGHAENLAEDDLAQAGIEGLFPKPLDLDSLTAFLEHVWEKERPTEEMEG
jgi:DNA-binding NtrC family response regulator